MLYNATFTLHKTLVGVDKVRNFLKKNKDFFNLKLTPSTCKQPLLSEHIPTIIQSHTQVKQEDDETAKQQKQEQNFILEPILPNFATPSQRSKIGSLLAFFNPKDTCIVTNDNVS